MKDNPQDRPSVSLPQWQRFGALLRDRRNAAKLSRLALAQRAQVSDATIKFIETARHPASRSTLLRLRSVAELHLSWADVPGHQEPPAERPSTPSPSSEPAPDAPTPDSAQFLMDLIGFDEIRLPQGAPKNLRIFRERAQDDRQSGGVAPKDQHEGD